MSCSPKNVPRAEATGIPVIDIPQWVFWVADTVAQGIAKRLVDETVKSTIRWANTGFDGNPAFVTNPEGFFRETASGALGDIISNDPNLGFLCSPFQAQIKLSLVRQYVEPETQYQCTIEQIGGNFENFVNNFDEGGWDAWFAVSQSESSNPYGAYIKAKVDTDQRIMNLIGQKKDELEINSGFLNKTTCDGIKNPDAPKKIRQAYDNGERGGEVGVWLKQGWKPGVAPGKCLGREIVTTPGDTIKNALDGTIGSGLNRLIDVDGFNQLVGAFATGLLDRYVFGERGLFGSGYSDSFNKSSQPAKIPAAKFGWVPCAKEGELCEIYDSDRVRMGFNKTAQKILEDVEENVMCDREVFDFPNRNDLSGSLQKQLLVQKDQNCYFYGQTRGPYSPEGDLSNWIPCAKEGELCSFEGARQIRYGSGFLFYLRVANESINCTNSSFGGNPTQFDDPDREKGCEYRAPSTETDIVIPIDPTVPPVAPTEPTFACYPSKTPVNRFEQMTWVANSTYPNGTYPNISTYIWSGSELSDSTSGSAISLTTSYNNPGVKTASVIVRQPGKTDITYQCGGSVVVNIGIGGGTF